MDFGPGGSELEIAKDAESPTQFSPLLRHSEFSFTTARDFKSESVSIKLDPG